MLLAAAVVVLLLLLRLTVVVFDTFIICRWFRVVFVAFLISFSHTTESKWNVNV